MTTAVWEDESSLQIGPTRFRVSDEPNDYLNEVSTPEDFLLVKPRHMVERLLELSEDTECKRIVEVGIFKGGSIALLAAAFQPERLTALELSTEHIDALDSFIHDHDLSDVVRPWYGIDQGDVAAVLAAIEIDHGDAPLDLVIDDASHLYVPTRSTFETLFPRLRPGGRYIIEDWSWAHFDEPLWQDRGGWYHDRAALTNLIIELLMVLGTGTDRPSGGDVLAKRARDLICDIHVGHDTVEVIRGAGVHEGPIKLEEHYLNRGLPFRPLL